MTTIYSRIWRWHFFAAFIVIPFVLWQAVTGTIYLWSQDFERRAHPELLSVIPQGTRISYDTQLATVRQQHPGEKLSYLEVSDDPSRSTTFFFVAANRLPYPVFVDPYSGKYLGDIAPARWLVGLTRGLHGGWPIEPYGSYLLELGACWSIVMLLTGLYLWWPRAASGFAGLLYPRLREGSRVFWRDIHSVVGGYFSLIVLAFLFTALPWTTFWGNQILKPLEHATGQEAPNERFFRSGSKARQQHHDSGIAPSSSGSSAHAAALSLDVLIALARAEGARDILEVRGLSGSAPVSIRSRSPRAADEIYLQFDRTNGGLLSKATWQGFPPVAKLVATGVDLHEGTFFGRSNQIFNTLVASALVWLAITGLIGWYRRRPRGGLAAPPKRALVLPKPVIGIGAVLCVVLPMLGASVLTIMLMDFVAGWRLSSRRMH